MLPVDPELCLQEAAADLERAGVERPVFEAQLLLALAVGGTRLDVIRGLGRSLTPAESGRFREMVASRASRVPLAYLRGTQEFYGLEFLVSPAVLVPRPETEVLVDFAVEVSASHGGRPASVIVDVGTGSGCIALSVAVRVPCARVLAVDLSPEALAVARANVERLCVEEHVLLARSNMLSAVRPESADLVLANPPYIPTDEVAELQPEVRMHEPRMALDGGRDGLVFHRALIEGAWRALRPGGGLGIEVALGQADLVAGLVERAGFESVARRRDLAGIVRVVTGWKP